MTDRVRFRQADMVRAIKAAHSAGMAVSRVRISPDGAIELELGTEPGRSEETPEPLGQWLVNDEAFAVEPRQ